MRAHPAILALAVLALTGTASVAQVIDGRLLEEGSDRPVPAAWVSLMAAGRVLHAAESDGEGRFRLQAPGPGWYSLRVERLGYALVNTDTLAVNDGENVEVSLVLSVSPVALTPVLVERRASVQVRSDLQRRMETAQRTGLGRFVTRESLDSVSSRTVTGVLMRVPLVTIATDATGKAWPITQSQGTCKPTLYLNNARMTFGPGDSIDDVIQPSQLEAIEVYRNRTELPREFAGIGHCAAIVFWTRTGESTRGGAWRYVLGAAAAFTLMLSFVLP